MKILSGSLYEPYSTDDFVSYDELAFTKSGVKLIGEDKILKNRIKLFMAIQKNLKNIEEKSSTAIGKIFYLINEHLQNKNKDTCGNYMKADDRIDDAKANTTKVKNTKVNDTNSNVDPDNNSIVKRPKISDDEDSLYKSFSDLRLVPLKELKSKISNPFKSSIHPMGDPIFRDYLRLKTILDFPILDLNTSLLFRFETCDEFLRLLSTLIIHKNPTDFIFEAFTLLVDGVDNFKIFFEILGCRLLFDYPAALTKINKSSSKLDFYSKTISFYYSEFDQLEDLFYESYEKKVTRVLRGFIQNLKYAEKFVDLILENFDLFLLSELIGDLDHSFYPLFVKKLLKVMHSDVMHTNTFSPSKILSFIVPRLSFNLNPNLNSIWFNRIEEAKISLEALLNINKIPEYKSKCPTTLILRNYQVEGVKWINFLYSFHLNGILADDMGLGKTIQVLYFICSEIYETNKKVLILCPSSLTGHWKGEIEKFYPFIKCEVYKKKKMENDTENQILISSYDMFRNDYQNFIDKNWFYIILDEGHILRNSNTRLYNRVCQLKPTNKLVLTGTPVHNSVEDLISIFNFIMPKYLENSENIQISLKMSDQEVEKAYARLADLNKKILPFILRRLKIDVLKIYLLKL
ncbi:helicase mot1 [Nosema bombycis CQ1]|uniref:Helicase mot1 n=1 Tax=Nosema bombycis (strain CQ1 / CVCC 102059) TaxID=578461 RepID=R0KNC9_NOSB1|nr:helicase mot1 [Nosema bombycis CQ1]|eukprot:EOB12176.1 helicase mot1 [Nosema bombycis CQ1]